MIAGKKAKFLTSVLPMFYRKCPNGNAHLRSEDVCDCCPSNEFVYVNGKWKPLGTERRSNNSSLSWSGQLASTELWWSAVKQGLILALVAIAIVGYGLWQAEQAVSKAAKGIQKNITNQSNGL
jgi:hypothetical protein